MAQTGKKKKKTVRTVTVKVKEPLLDLPPEAVEEEQEHHHHHHHHHHRSRKAKRKAALKKWLKKNKLWLNLLAILVGLGLIAAIALAFNGMM